MPTLETYIKCGHDNCQGQLIKIASTAESQHLTCTDHAIYPVSTQSVVYECETCNKLWVGNREDGTIIPQNLKRYVGLLTRYELMASLPYELGVLDEDMEERIIKRLDSGYTNKEERVIVDLMAKSGLSRQSVLRQALRVYQSVAEGASILQNQFPTVGSIAMCSRGIIGVIEGQPTEITYLDGNKATAWVGRCLWPEESYNKPWSSRNPTILWQAPVGCDCD